MVSHARDEPAGHTRPARGAVFLLIAQGVILVGGFGISIILGRALGPEMFGVYGVVIAVLTLFERVLAAGIPRAVGGMIARGQGDRAELEQSARVLLALWSVVLGAGLWIAAPALAAYLNVDAVFFRILALNLPLTAVFLAYDAIFAGRRAFATQSMLQTVQSIVKLAAVGVLLVVGLSVEGALTAHVGGTLAVAAMALILYPPGLRRPSFALMRTIVRDAFALGFYAVALALLLNVGLWQLETSAPEPLIVGLYVAAMNVARALVVVPASLSGVLFSTGAWASGAAQLELFRKYVREAVRFGMILLLPAFSLLAVDAEPIVRLLFGAQYAGGGPVLVTLLAAYVAFGFFDILVSALMAERRYKLVAVLVSALVPVLIVLNAAVIPAYGGIGVGAAMVAVFMLGIILSAAQVYRGIGNFVPVLSLLRTAGACALVAALSAFVPAAEWWQLAVKLPMLGALYVGVLWVARELSAEDLAALVKKKAKPAL